MNPDHPIRRQYERFPYPPVHFLALPKRNQGQGLRYEVGTALGEGIEKKSHRGIRILVAGAGTLEALVVAQSHPSAKEVVAVDLSENSLAQLERRIRLARVARFPLKIPPIRLLCQDLHQPLSSSAIEEPFDYIVASNVVHHSPKPDQLLDQLASQLRQGGLLRLVTYPQMSRIWMRQVSLWLQIHGLTPSTPRLVHRCRTSFESLPKHHPIRLCFETCSESKTPTGIVDAWMNACENPLAPWQWKTAVQTASLRLIGETQTESSRTSFLDEVVPELRTIGFWEKLQILDDLLELCANPVLWFQKVSAEASNANQTSLPSIQVSDSDLVSETPPLDHSELLIPSRVFWEMKKGLLRTEAILLHSNTGISLKELFRRFKEEVGPRVDPKNSKRPLTGLALTDYDLTDVLQSQKPWNSKHWEALQIKYGDRARLVYTDPRAATHFQPNSDPDCFTELAQQEKLVQLQNGAFTPSIRVKVL